MADGNTGVTSTPAGTEHHTAPGGKKQGSFFKKNKPLVIGGGLLAVFILMGRNKGSGVGTAQPQTGLTPADNLAAYQAGADFGSGLAGTSSGGAGSGGGDTGTGGSGSTTPPDTTGTGGEAGAGGTAGTAASTAPLVSINIDSTTPGTSSTKATPAKTTAPNKSPGNSGPLYAVGAKPVAGALHKGEVAMGQTHAEKVRAKEPHRTKPPAAGKPATMTKTKTGTHHHSPAAVESVDGWGSGVTVMGRQFPGAISHQIMGPRIGPNGSIIRDVKVNYGGHTDVHAVCNDGSTWIDNVKGANPPSRGVPVATPPVAR